MWKFTKSHGVDQELPRTIMAVDLRLKGISNWYDTQMGAIEALKYRHVKAGTKLHSFEL